MLNTPIKTAAQAHTAIAQLLARAAACACPIQAKALVLLAEDLLALARELP